jgi:hypothetical protein
MGSTGCRCGKSDMEPRSWVTRERPKIDRIACPWLIRRFIDPGPEFLFTPTERVFAVAEETGATAYDIGPRIFNLWFRYAGIRHDFPSAGSRVLHRTVPKRSASMSGDKRFENRTTMPADRHRGTIVIRNVPSDQYGLVSALWRELVLRKFTNWYLQPEQIVPWYQRSKFVSFPMIFNCASNIWLHIRNR